MDEVAGIKESLEQTPKLEPLSILRKFSWSSTMKESRTKRLELEQIDSKVTTPRSRAHGDSKGR